MKKISTTVSYETDDFGGFEIITRMPPYRTSIFWDIEDTGGTDGIEMTEEVLRDESYYIRDVIGMEIDFSDLPPFGDFTNHDEAYNYLVKKFGNIE